MDIECKHVLEEMDGYVFCAECGLEIDRFFGYFYSGFKKKEKNYHCDKCNKSFLKEQGLKRHYKSKNHLSR